MIEGKGLGNKKVNRVGLSLSNRYDSKLRKFATACNLKHTTLAGILIEKALDNVQFVHEEIIIPLMWLGYASQNNK